MDKEEDKKEGFLKRLKNIEANQKSNSNDKSNFSSARSELSTKTLINDDEAQTFEYLKDNTDDFFLGYSSIFDSDLEEFFNYIASEDKKSIDYELLLEQILLPSGNVFSFLQKYGDLYNFWTNVLINYTNCNNIKL